MWDSVRRSTRKLAKFILGQHTGTAAQTTGETTQAQQVKQTDSMFKLILTLNVNKTNLNVHSNPHIYQNINMYSFQQKKSQGQYNVTNNAYSCKQALAQMSLGMSWFCNVYLYKYALVLHKICLSCLHFPSVYSCKYALLSVFLTFFRRSCNRMRSRRTRPAHMVGRCYTDSQFWCHSLFNLWKIVKSWTKGNEVYSREQRERQGH